jgi:hypothetical protein
MICRDIAPFYNTLSEAMESLAIGLSFVAQCIVRSL